MKFDSFDLAGKKVGKRQPCFVIGEIAQAHDGSLGTAHAYIDAIAKAGADAIKFQTHIAHAESTIHEPFRVKFSQQDDTRYDYWKRMEFTAEQWAGLAEHAAEQGLVFLSSPFSEEAVELLDKIGTPAWKIASGEVNNPLLTEAMYATKKPILLSSGMSSFAEIDAVVNDVKKRELPLAVFQCTSKYPSSPVDIGLNVLQAYQERYQVPVGLSDHSGKIYAGLAAATLGANLIEVHVTMSRELFGPDVPVSLTTSELRQLVDGVRFIEEALANPVDKEAMAASMAGMRNMFGKSLVLKRDLKAGDHVQRTDLTAKKPALGVLAEHVDDVIGKKLNRDIPAGDFLKAEDLVD